MTAAHQSVHIPPLQLEADLFSPARPSGIVIFAHGSGSSRFSPRNRSVAQALVKAGFAALLLDLLTEREAENRANVFDIDLLGDRLADAIDWAATRLDLARLPVGLFGASTGAAAAMRAAAARPDRVAAVVSRGGRADLAADVLDQVTAPVLLIVGGEDEPVLSWNRDAMKRLSGPARLEIVPGATHLFEEPGALQQVVRLAIAWFAQTLSPAAASEA